MTGYFCRVSGGLFSVPQSSSPTITACKLGYQTLIFPPAGKPLYPGKYEHEQLLLMSEGVCTSNSVFCHESSMIELTRDPSYSEKPIHPLSDRLPGKSYQSGKS